MPPISTNDSRFIHEKAKLNNKNQHITNGNIGTDEDIKMIQLNTGNGQAHSTNSKVRHAIDTTNAKIIIISESNINVYDPEEMVTREKCFPDFNLEDKILPGCKNARVSIYIHKSLEYTRRIDLENEINSTLCIKIRRSKNKWTCIVATYRQWTGMSSQCSYNGRCRSNGLSRFNDLINLYIKILAENNDTVFAGDYNIDRLKANNPSKRYDLKLIRSQSA